MLLRKLYEEKIQVQAMEDNQLDKYVGFLYAAAEQQFSGTEKDEIWKKISLADSQLISVWLITMDWLRVVL